jgi:hypothetical protein
MKEEEFLGEMKWFCEYYSEFKPNKRLIKVWIVLTSTYTVDQLRRAMMEHIKVDDNPNFPAFGKIYQQLIKIKRVAQ